MIACPEMPKTMLALDTAVVCRLYFHLQQPTAALLEDRYAIIQLGSRTAVLRGNALQYQRVLEIYLKDDWHLTLSIAVLLSTTVCRCRWEQLHQIFVAERR